MKNDNCRNFESGILTNDLLPVQVAMEQFDCVWRGDHCAACGRKQDCGESIKG